MTKIEEFTAYLTYDELTKLVERYLREIGELENSESVIFMDIPVSLEENTGEVEIDIEVSYLVEDE